MSNLSKESKVSQKGKTYQMVLIGLMAAVTCILAPLSILLPGGVPLSFTNLVIYLTVFLLGWKKGTISYLIYMLIGLVGLPVFSNFTGGFAKLAGPTGGYIIGFIFMAIIGGYFAEKFGRKIYMFIIGMVIGTAITYGFGTAWFIVINPMPIKAALASCVMPFLLGDAIKMAIVSIVGPIIYKALGKAGIIL